MFLMYRLPTLEWPRKVVVDKLLLAAIAVVVLWHQMTPDFRRRSDANPHTERQQQQLKAASTASVTFSTAKYQQHTTTFRYLAVLNVAEAVLAAVSC